MVTVDQGLNRGFARRDDAATTDRKFYSEEWYMLLTTQQKRDLDAEAKLEFLTPLNDDI